VTVGGGATGFELRAETSYRQLAADVLVAVRSAGGFSIGIKPRASFSLDRLATSARQCLGGRAATCGRSPPGCEPSWRTHRA
jgi:hypothetical protein